MYWGSPSMGTHFNKSGTLPNRNLSCFTSLSCEDVERTGDAPHNVGHDRVHPGKSYVDPFIFNDLEYLGKHAEE